jgi:hypothetical protein
LEKVSVVLKKLVIVDTLATSGKAKVVFLAKDGGISKGSGTDPSGIGVALTIAYGNGLTAGNFVEPQGDAGWIANGPTVAKFVNPTAPAGASGAKVTVVKPGKLAKLVGSSLGDSPLDLIGAGDPAGPVRTAYCVTNAGEQVCFCSVLTDCTYKSIAAGTGAKLVCRTGSGDPSCQALSP